MKGFAWVVGGALACWALGAQAEDGTGLNPAIVKSNRSAVLSIGVLNQDYFEYDDHNSVPTTWLDKEKGNLATVAGRYGWTGGRLLYEAHARYAGGDTAYDGYLQNLVTGAVTPATSTTGNNIVDLRFNFGYMLPAGDAAVITPGVEAGYHFWNRDVGKDGVGGITERYSDLRVGATLTGQLALTPRLVLKARGAVGSIVLAGMQADAINFSERLGNKPYYRATVGGDYRLTGRLHLNADASYEAFGYGESKVNRYGFLEPRSRTRQASYLLGVGYEF